MFSSFQFSPDNTTLMYVAEKKLRKTEPYYKQKPKSKVVLQENEEEPERVRNHKYVSLITIRTIVLYITYYRYQNYI